MEGYIGTATIFKLDIQMFTVEPERADGRQQLSRLSSLLLTRLPSHRFRPALTNSMAETQSTTIL